MNNSSWLYPANIKYYKVIEAFSNNYTYWPKKSNVENGDEIYIYLSAPYKRVAYKCLVVDNDIGAQEAMDSVKEYIIDGSSKKDNLSSFIKLEVVKNYKLDESSKLSLDKLRENGLKGFLMGPRKLNNSVSLLTYIESIL